MNNTPFLSLVKFTYVDNDEDDTYGYVLSDDYNRTFCDTLELAEFNKFRKDNKAFIDYVLDHNDEAGDAVIDNAKEFGITIKGQSLSGTELENLVGD